MIPALEQIIKRGGQLGLKEIAFGMAHRGRLNVLSQVMGKPHRVIFHEFKGGSASPDEVEGSGDVKYHLGASSDREFDGNTVHLSLTANPSHLEIVDPVVLGKVRAKQDQLDDYIERVKVLPLLIHGDAAFAGQGVVAECFGLSGLRGHRTGGSLHFIVNNQIGFTTYPRYSRSSPYPSDVAKLVEAPIFHVNGDDPEAVVFCAKVATEYRQKFHKPVVIDMFCYRRFGHNEGDEPAFTQPLMYRNIRSHPTTLQIYAKKLVEQGIVTQGEVDKMRADWRHRLEAEYEAGQAYVANKADWLDGRWAGFKSAQDLADDDRRGETGVDLARLRQIGERITSAPAGFSVHKTIQRFLDNRRATIETGEGIDWATGEALAFGSLLDEGFPVRLSGQDSERGTFSQRHSVLIDQQSEARYIPLNHIRDGQARYEVINSMLSEEAVLGFEYGYSLAEPNALTLWEAQFGDFANGAQVVFDQFISSGERKWLRMSGLVCLLPHGYEGQGPEHSSARLERFLQLCAEDNMQVVACSTPANFFHALRRQLKRDIRKPLIVMTPKSMLRNKRAVSNIEAFAPGASFHRLLWDSAETHKGEKIKLARDEKIRRVILCSGKVYYDLYEEREKRGIDDVYLLRVEQLYPFPLKSLVKELDAVQEGRSDLVPGGAEEHGRVDLRRALSRMGARPGRRQVQARALRRPSGRRGDRDRPDVQASRPAQGLPRRVLRVRRTHAPAAPSLGRLTESSEMLYFLCRLTPPRKTFLADMAADERELMGAHQAYWRPFVEAGSGDRDRRRRRPRRRLGRRDSRGEFARVRCEALQAGDPVIAANRGFRYETYPMPTISLRPAEPRAPVSSVSP